jgi:hypothetical protein
MYTYRKQPQNMLSTAQSWADKSDTIREGQRGAARVRQRQKEAERRREGAIYLPHAHRAV